MNFPTAPTVFKFIKCGLALTTLISAFVQSTESNGHHSTAALITMIGAVLVSAAVLGQEALRLYDQFTENNSEPNDSTRLLI